MSSDLCTITVSVSDGSSSASDTFTLTVNASPRQVWWIANLGTTDYSGNAAANADPDGDNVVNLAEWAFGLNPNVSDGGGIAISGAAITQRGNPVVTIANTAFGVDYRALFGRRKDYVSAGLTYTVQFSADMSSGSWEDSADIPTVIASDAEMDAVTVPYPFFMTTGDKAQFFRVRITLP